MAITNKRPRKIRQATYKSFRLQKRIKSTKPPLPTVRQLAKGTISTLAHNKRFFIVYTLLYGVLSLIFIQGGVSRINITQTKDILTGSLGSVPSSIALYFGLVGTSTQFGDQVAALYQFILVIIFGLAIIYGLRHMYGAEARPIRIKESLYKGMTPLIPFVLVLLVLALQLLPLSIGTSLYATVTSTGIAATSIERILWLLFTLLLSILSLYWVCGSIFALFIVTLPGMTPMKAMRASRDLVRHRRLIIAGKLLFLLLALLVGVGLVVTPFIVFVPAIAQAVFLICSALVLPLTITYMYNLYRSML